MTFSELLTEARNIGTPLPKVVVRLIVNYVISNRKIKSYLANPGLKALHIGCGERIISGWLNADLYPYAINAVYLNATKKFPFADMTFDCIYTEHMIEHISYFEGVSMIRQCYRVLKTGGKLRVATPDLRFLMELCQTQKTSLQKDYIKWQTDNFLHGIDRYEDVFVINNYVRAWGHQFIYDENTLATELERAGFTDIERFQVNVSKCEPLKGLELTDRLPRGMYEMETIVFEAKK
ncbi:MAG: class I SAM-dependent methyltransferase [Methylococcales bacterium]